MANERYYGCFFRHVAKFLELEKLENRTFATKKILNYYNEPVNLPTYRFEEIFQVDPPPSFLEGSEEALRDLRTCDCHKTKDYGRQIWLLLVHFNGLCKGKNL